MQWVRNSFASYVNWNFYWSTIAYYLTQTFYWIWHIKFCFAGANIRAGDAVRHSFLDGTFDVLCSVVALKITQAHPFSRSLFNMVAIFLLIENHSGYDFPTSIHNLLPFFAGPVIHRRHHQKGTTNYAKFFTWCDYFCGTLSWTKIDYIISFQTFASVTIFSYHYTVSKYKHDCIFIQIVNIGYTTNCAFLLTFTILQHHSFLSIQSLTSN